MQERRSSVRHRVFKFGTIGFNGGGGISCRIKNLSEAGAMLQVASVIGIPSRFTLLVEPDQVLKECQVVWKRPDLLGVRFVTAS